MRTLYPNTTQFPNVLLDVLLPILSPSEWKVLAYVVRRTYGWQRERERIPFAEFEDGRLTADGKRRIDAGTGLSRPTLTRAVYVLHAAGILEAQGERTQARTYWLHLDFDPNETTDDALSRHRAEYDRKLESLQMKLPIPREDMPPRKRRAVPVSVPVPAARPQRSPDRLLAIDIENVRKGRITVGSVARRRKLSAEDVQRLVDAKA